MKKWLPCNFCGPSQLGHLVGGLQQIELYAIYAVLHRMKQRINGATINIASPINTATSLLLQQWNIRTSRASTSYTFTTPLSLPTAKRRFEFEDEDGDTAMLVVLVPPCHSKPRSKKWIPKFDNRTNCNYSIVGEKKNTRIKSLPDATCVSLFWGGWRRTTSGFNNVYDASQRLILPRWKSAEHSGESVCQTCTRPHQHLKPVRSRCLE